MLPWVLAANRGSKPIILFVRPAFQKRLPVIPQRRAFVSAANYDSNLNRYSIRVSLLHKPQ